MWRTVFKVICGLLVVAVITGCSSLLATIYATRQIAAVIRQSSDSAQSQTELIPDGMTSASFQELTHIPTDELSRWFDTLSAEHGLKQVRLVMRFSDAAGRCLVNSAVGLRWNDGIQWANIGSSGLAEFALSEEQTRNLTVIFPQEFSVVHQWTFPLGDRYEETPQLARIDGATLAIDDDRIQQALYRELQKVRTEESVHARLNAAAGLRRSTTLPMTEVPSKEIRTPEEIYQAHRDSLVVVGLLRPDGQISQGTGFVISNTGVIVTNFHVVDKPNAIAAGILTSDLRFFEFQEFLAGSPSDDIAVLRVNTSDLRPIPLANHDAEVGAELLALTHPDSHYFSMTFGRTTRYFQTFRHATPSLRMGITADFSEGSSGGPLLDSHGNVLGLVSATRGDSRQMVHREAIPVSSLRRLVGKRDEPIHTNTGRILTISQDNASPRE